jgi:hypothetical protein
VRPLVAELVEQELELRERNRHHDQEARPFLSVAQYAYLHHATPAAVRARIRRGQLDAIRPPGGREYLIPNDAVTITADIEAPATSGRPGA